MTVVLNDLQFKVNDVFSFRYNEKETKDRFEPYHCFDGQLIVKKTIDNELYLEDTYWGSSSNKRYTIEQAISLGHLTFKCNLDEVERIAKHDLDYYNDKDIFNLSTQHGCYPSYAKRKGAEKCKDKIQTIVLQKIAKEEYDKSYSEREIIRLNEVLVKVKSGDTSVYI